MAPHSSTLAWKIPWMEEPSRLQSMGSLKSDMTERLHFHFSLSCIREGTGNPLQCSCLENPSGEGAWWIAVYGVTQGRTWLKWLSSSSSSSKLIKRESVPINKIINFTRGEFIITIGEYNQSKGNTMKRYALKIGQPRRNEKFLRNMQTSTNKSGRNRKIWTNQLLVLKLN